MTFQIIDGPTSSQNWMNIRPDGWIITGVAPGVGGICPSFEVYPYKGVNYLKFNSQSYTEWNGYYLSVNKNGYLGLYKWTGASGWKISDNHLISTYNGQSVGITAPIEEDGRQWQFYQASSSLAPITVYKDSNPELYQGLGA